MLVLPTTEICRPMLGMYIYTTYCTFQDLLSYAICVAAIRRNYFLEIFFSVRIVVGTR